MEKAWSSSATEMFTKAFIKMEFLTDSESITGRTDHSTKAISFKD